MKQNCSDQITTHILRNFISIRTGLLQVAEREELLVAVGLADQPAQVVVLGGADASASQRLQAQQSEESRGGIGDR